MNFGNWSSVIHYDSEQQKRIASAKKADTSPNSVDVTNQTALFQGSGKFPYKTNLNSCTCGDYTRRALPCKHIYRLAMELGLIEDHFATGRNKNAISDDVFALPEDAQKMLHSICYQNIYAQQPYYACERNEIGEALISSGFCKEVPVSLDIISIFPVSSIKKLLFSSEIDGLPKITSIKKTFVRWLSNNKNYAFPLLNSHYCFLEITEQTEHLKHTIYRRLAKELYPNEEFEEDVITFTINL